MGEGFFVVKDPRLLELAVVSGTRASPTTITVTIGAIKVAAEGIGAVGGLVVVGADIFQRTHEEELAAEVQACVDDSSSPEQCKACIKNSMMGTVLDVKSGGASIALTGGIISAILLGPTPLGIIVLGLGAYGIVTSILDQHKLNGRCGQIGQP